MAKDREDRKSKPLSEEEVSLFRDAVGSAVPLIDDRVEKTKRPVHPRARFRRADDAAVLDESLRHGQADQERLAGDRLHFRRPGLSGRAMRKLVRGGFRVEAETDLHGLNVNEAKKALREFLEEGRRYGYRCVRVVHGKGKRSGHRGPVLKFSVDAWLRQWDSVLAFASAKPADGGTGAVYVLLKTN